MQLVYPQILHSFFVFDFSWDDCIREKLETTLMQNLGEKQGALWSINIFRLNRRDTDEHYGGYNLLQNKI